MTEYETNIHTKIEQTSATEDASTKNQHYIHKPQLKQNGRSKLFIQFSKGMKTVLIFGACILFYFSLLRLDMISAAIGKVLHILKPIIYGFAIAYILNPILKFTEKHMKKFLNKHFPKIKNSFKLCRITGIFVSLVVLLTVIITLCNMMLPELFRSIRDMVITVPGQLYDAINQITKISTDQTPLGEFFRTILQEGTEFIRNWIGTDLVRQINVMMSSLTEGIINIVSELVNFIIGLIISIYLLFSKEKFSRQCKKMIYAIFSPSKANLILHITIKSDEMFGGFIIGKIIDSAIIGILCFLGLSILDMPYTLLVSVVVGATNVIPFFGPYIGAIPSAILIMLSDPKMGIYFLIFILILQQIDGNIIGPKILGDSTGLSAFWVVFSILLGGGLFGIVGMILGVPTFAVIYYLIGLWVDTLLTRKNLPTDTDSYDEMSYVSADGGYMPSESACKHKENKEDSNHADTSAK